MKHLYEYTSGNTKNSKVVAVVKSSTYLKYNAFLPYSCPFLRNDWLGINKFDKDSPFLGNNLRVAISLFLQKLAATWTYTFFSECPRQ